MRLRASLVLGELLLLGCPLVYIHCEEVFGILGENFTFPVKIDKKLMEITWKKNKDKVAEWEEQSQTVFFNSLRNRGSLNNETGGLTIFNLEKNDTASYALEYLSSDERTSVLTFILTVLDPPSEPTIICNISGDDLILKCAADFKKPLKYSWKFSSITEYKQHQDVVTLKSNVDASEKTTCFIKISQTEKNSEFSLNECFPGDRYYKRRRAGLIVAFVLLLAVVIIPLLYKKVRRQSKIGRHKHSLQKHSSGEEEPIVNVDSQVQSSSDVRSAWESGPSATQAAERGVNGSGASQIAEDDRGQHLGGSPSRSEEGASQIAEDDRGQHLGGSPSRSEEDVRSAWESGPSATQAAERGVNGSGASQIAEDDRGQHLGGSPSRSEEDLKS
ncbi:lymphocyte function-associated antigen 3 isoform X2 [Rhea pennata]|uniref:lymphocyte function-associated antigen 3 isoform X2 n=1 Tax=Rhea pennata TaxID=8795 RepID=UPI002E266BB3